MSNTETKTIKIPFVKKNESDLSKKKYRVSIILLIKMKIFMSMIMSDIWKHLVFYGQIPS